MVASTSAPSTFGIDRYLQIRTAQMPTWSPDGRNVAFIADITGVPQLWQVSVDGGWPEQLTFTPDRIMTAHYTHEGPGIVFGMDQGGNEREQIFLLHEGRVTDIAVDPEVMHVFGAIAPNDRQIAYSNNSRHPAHFDVYTRDLDGSNERCVYQQNGSNFVADWSPDGLSLLISRRTGSLDMELLLLDISTGQTRHLTPHHQPTTYTQAVFAPDGKSAYLITNQDSEYSRAAQIDLRTGEVKFLTDDSCDVDWIRLTPDGRCLAVVRNDEGYNRLSIRSTRSGNETPAPDLPRAVILQPEWSSDGRRLAFSLTSPDNNLNVWIWDEDGTCRQLTRVAMGGIPRATFVAPELVRFSSFDGRAIPGFLYLPDAKQPPVIINVHGGPESQAQPIFNPITQFFINQGYAVFAPNVRGSTGYGREYTHLDDVEKRMDSVADLQAAAEWLRASGQVDGERLVVMGGSYGGFMVLAALTTYPELWAAGVDIVGIADMETFLRNTSQYRRHWRVPEYGDPDRDAELLRSISPIHSVDKIAAPLMVIHGDNDPRVPLSEAEQMVAALRNRGRPVEFLHFADEGHGIIKLANKLVAYPAIAAFLERYIATENTSAPTA